MTEALRIERRPDKTALLWLDLPGEKVNTLKAGFGDLFTSCLDELDRDREIEAAALVSGKPDDFIAGADINLLASMKSAEEAAALSRRAQRAMDRAERLRVPLVAAIHGNCLGGGLELSLACRGRVASDSDRTRIGLPEVKIGVFPGAGGTQRLPRLIGLAAALDLILTGRTVSARRALSLGLVDEVVPRAILVDVALAHARRLALRPRPARRPGWVRLFLEGNPLGRRLMYRRARREILAQTQGAMPAPLRAIEAVRVGLEQGPGKGYAFEAEEFGRLAVSPRAKNLMRLFFAVTELKKDPGTDETAEARPVAKVGIVGSGLMGTGIAYVTAAEAGRPVRIKDVGHEPLRKALRAIHGILSEQVGRRRMTESERDGVLALVGPTTDYSGFRRAGVVIEAVVEDLEVKRRVLREVEEHGGPEVIFATNTSSIPIDRIAAAASDPSRVIGMHYFSPVDKRPLLEVVVGPRTAPWVVATCVKLGKAQGKTAVVVRDGPGFYTTRILAPYINEAGHLLAEGVSVEEIDRALVRFGFPVGPLKLLDEVGIDTSRKIGKMLEEAFGDRMAPAPALEKVYADGRMGRKNGRGFYMYDTDRPKRGGRKVDPTVYGAIGVRRGTEPAEEEIVRRCVLLLVNEAVRCLAEGIVRSKRDGDVGAVMGLGFPPFRGGPFRYVEEVGPGLTVGQLRELERKHGARFAPAPLLEKWARERDNL